MGLPHVSTGVSQTRLSQSLEFHVLHGVFFRAVGIRLRPHAALRRNYLNNGRSSASDSDSETRYSYPHYYSMKRSILTLTIAVSLLSAAPVLQARDHDHGHYDDYQSDVHSLWEWYGHLRSEADARGGRHTRDELEGIRGNLKHVEDEMHDRHFHEDRVRGELDGIRDDLRHVSDELNWRGEIHHRPGFSIEFH